MSHFQLELTAGASFYTVNKEFYQGKTRSQEYIGSLQGHIEYNFKRGIWAAIDGTYYWGGSTTVDGVEGNDLQKNTRLGCTLALPLSLHNSLKLYYSTGVSTRTGSDFDLIGAVWQYRWGGGLARKGKNLSKKLLQHSPLFKIIDKIRNMGFTDFSQGYSCDEYLQYVHSEIIYQQFLHCSVPTQ